MGKLSTEELLALIKKEGRCRNNQELLELLERLCDEMRKKRARTVYDQSRREVARMGTHKTAELPVEIEMQRDNEQ